MSGSAKAQRPDINLSAIPHIRTNQSLNSDPVDMDLTTMLPEDVLLDVLGRLSPRSLAVSRCICKAWRAAVDDHRLLRTDLLPISLEGIFLELYDPHVTPRERLQEYPIPVLFSRPSTGRKIPADVGYPKNWIDYERWILDCCNGLLLLRNDRVVNPATRQWAQVPQRSGACLITDCYRCSYTKYLLFDPTVSPHYEVLSVPEIPDYFPTSTRHIGKHECKDKSLSTMEWPPTPYIMDVFSSRTGEWEERSFFREGRAAGTVADCDAYKTYQGTAYWHGALYVICGYDFVLRIKLSNNTYQVIELPKEKKGFYERRLGKSEKGVYCAYRCAGDVFQIWFLDESRGQTEWVLKSDINLEPVPWRPGDIVRGSWILQEFDHHEAQVLEEKSEWDPDDAVSAKHWLEMRGSGKMVYDFLGFHPYKEIVILTSFSRVMAYHLNTSKVRDLGYIHLGSNDIEISFPYTPCWMGPLPGASEHLI